MTKNNSKTITTTIAPEALLWLKNKQIPVSKYLASKLKLDMIKQDYSSLDEIELYERLAFLSKRNRDSLDKIAALETQLRNHGIQ